MQREQVWKPSIFWVLLKQWRLGGNLQKFTFSFCSNHVTCHWRTFPTQNSSAQHVTLLLALCSTCFTLIQYDFWWENQNMFWNPVFLCFQSMWPWAKQAMTPSFALSGWTFTILAYLEFGKSICYFFSPTLGSLAKQLVTAVYLWWTTSPLCFPHFPNRDSHHLHP